ncbi:MAG TPA: hypothetical protein VGI93_10775 [Steroidobacteraceae bacterium]
MNFVRRAALMIGFATALAASFVRADTFTYDVNYFGMAGDIVASCDNCPLTNSDVVSWALSGQGISLSSSASDANLSISGSSFQATPSVISYLFTPSSSDGATFNSHGNTFQLLSFGTAPSEAFEDVGNVLACQDLADGSSECSGAEVHGKQTIATRVPTAAPELDPAALSAAALLLFGAIAVFRGRRQVKGTIGT